MDGDATSAGGLEGEAILLSFTDALVRGEEGRLRGTRQALLEALGPEKVVDAVSVASNFERMVRIADATGIPLDRPLEVASAELRSELGLERFAELHAE
jgi:hypothetical protein